MTPTRSCGITEKRRSFSDTPGSPAATGGSRLVSLDALRGFDMFWIVGAGSLVHALGKVRDTGVIKVFSKQLSHVQWEGFHFYDLIFPLFVRFLYVRKIFIRI